MLGFLWEYHSDLCSLFSSAAAFAVRRRFGLLSGTLGGSEFFFLVRGLPLLWAPLALCPQQALPCGP